MSQTLQQCKFIVLMFYCEVLQTPSLPVQVHSPTTSTTTNEKDWAEK